MAKHKIWGSGNNGAVACKALESSRRGLEGKFGKDLKPSRVHYSAVFTLKPEYDTGKGQPMTFLAESAKNWKEVMERAKKGRRELANYDAVYRVEETYDLTAEQSAQVAKRPTAGYEREERDSFYQRFRI